MKRLLLCLTLASLGVSCGRETPVSDWRLVISLPGVELPVSLHLEADNAWFRNGLERVEVPEVRQDGAQWILRFPAFNNTLQLARHGNRLEGTLTLVKRGYEQVMPVHGEPDPGWRFMAKPRPAHDLTGRWAVQLMEEDGGQTEAVAEFDQQGSALTGTFLTPTGDFRYLAGEVDGSLLRLSTFDGAHAFVFHARVLSDGSLDGDFWSGTRWHQSWQAQRDFDARLPDAYSLTFLKPGHDRVAFTFPDLDGNPVSLDDEKYRGKVVLVTLGGSWCPNCADEMAFLSGYFRDNRDRGLAIISLLYEHFEEFDLAAQQGRALVEEHGIEFDVLVAGVSEKTKAAETLPMLNHVMAYPTMIFIDRAGAVQGIHTGFSGPGTGPYYEAFKVDFEARMDRLLDAPPPAP